MILSNRVFSTLTVIFYIFLASGLTQLYHLQIFTKPMYANILITNALIVFGFWVYNRKKKSNDTAVWKLSKSTEKFRSVLEWGPVVLLWIFLLICCLISLIEDDRSKTPYLYQPILVILFVPIFEELLFRKYLGGIFRSKLGLLGGSYFSALYFSYLHSQPSFENLLAGNIGLVLGPFVLAIFSEISFNAKKHILPSIILHSLSNLSGYLFASFDSSWLHRLSWLYH